MLLQQIKLAMFNGLKTIEVYFKFFYFYSIFKGYFPFTDRQNVGYIPHVVQYILECIVHPLPLWASHSSTTVSLPPTGNN